MRDFKISADINATPERVWEVLSDGERWAEWTPSVTAVELLDKPLRVGGRALIQQPELPPAKFRITDAMAGGGYGEVRIMADPIGSNRTWTSPVINIVPGSQVELRVQNNIHISSYSVF